MKQAEMQMVVTEYMDRFFRDGLTIQSVDVERKVSYTSDMPDLAVGGFGEGGSIVITYWKPESQEETKT